MQKESDFLISNPKLVIGYLNDLIKNRCILSAYFGDGSRSFMTSMIALDAKKQVLELDCAPTDKLNSELLQSPKVLFRTEIDGIKVSFAGKGIKQIKKDGEKLFAMPIPESIFWMQRRQCYRVKIPAAHTHCYCQFVLQLEQLTDTGTVLMPQIARFKVADISISGFAFLNVTPAYSDHVQPHKSYKNCLLHLHDDDDSEARIAFEITNINKIREGRAIIAQRVGCKFTELPTGFEDIVQRYVNDIELQNRNTE